MKPICSKCKHCDRYGWCSKHEMDCGWYADDDGPGTCRYFQEARK